MAAAAQNATGTGETDKRGNLTSGDTSLDKVDLNSASLDEIRKIPQMGDKRARSIYDWRQTHGAFATIDDIEKVPGIGRAFVEMMRMYCTVK